MRDSYQIFMQRFGISYEQLEQFGITETIFIPKEEAEHSWIELKKHS